MADEIYGTVSGADAYHAARGHSDWADGSEADKQAALLRASVWLDGTYGYRYPGKKAGGREQERGWPRTNAVDCDGNKIPDDEVPVEIVNAAYEAALRELTSPGSLSPDVTPADGVKREKVGDLEVEYRDGGDAAEDAMPVLSVVDGLLACLVGRRSNTNIVWFGRA